ncbi:MAG: hypothetical protein ACQET1_03685 [Gemmatimonadota bacterium]
MGVWEATELRMTNQANPSQSVDLIEEGATFTLSILSDGRYSASLTIFGQGSTELGVVRVSGNNITIEPTTPEGPPLVATWSFQGQNLVLDGESEFDFNRDGIPEASIAHIVFEPQQARRLSRSWLGSLSRRLFHVKTSRPFHFHVSRETEGHSSTGG